MLRFSFVVAMVSITFGALACSGGDEGATAPAPTGPASPPPGSVTPPADPPRDAGPPPASYACVGTFPETPKITLPKDEARHGDFFEWWYWTGHLATASGRPFGFQLTFFESTPSATVPLVSGTMAHFSITDVDQKTFQHDYKFASLAPYPQKKDGFRVANETWWAEGTSGGYAMHAEMEGYALDLTLQDEKRAVYHFGDGYTAYPAPYAGYTYYDSRPRLRATGNVVVGGATLPVTGEVWMDQQWGQPPQTPAPFPLPPVVETSYGWNWFQFQLESGEELMLVRMHVKDGADGSFLASGTFVGKDCAFEPLEEAAFEIEPLGSWTSPHTGTIYPQNWHIRVPSKGLDLDATVLVADQEIYKHTTHPIAGTLTPAYWEGKVAVTGKGPSGPIRGRGYAEAVGKQAVKP